jgi:hypothetical protein
MKKCALPECRKIFTIGYGSCCCRSHQTRYAALVRHGKVTPVERKSYQGVRASFIGPPTPKHIKYKYPYIPTDQLSVDQQNKRRARACSRHKRVKEATPIWADLAKIQNLYLESIELSNTTGIQHEVDHIVPLKHNLVCGLHNQFNLRVIPKLENRDKSNQFEI